MGAVPFEVQLRDLARGSRRMASDLNDSEVGVGNTSASRFFAQLNRDDNAEQSLLEEPGIRDTRRYARVGAVCSGDLRRCLVS